ncbi:MAG: PhzF family phenazine biosynthesis protein [Acidimicrobiales bacterium]|nr:PhzF family phenazine biosynthesis protein [Acidimicrobiales bacterium]
MTQLEYHLLDVFTDRPFAGNGLAVFVDAPPLATAEMQAIARELNLSETVFVSTPVSGDAWPTRIFTPGTELPFAGHPTVGTAVLLAELGLVKESVALREGVGDIVCALDGNRATFTTASLPASIDIASADQLVESVGLAVEDLHPEFAVAGFSCGVPFAFLVVRDQSVLARCRIGNVPGQVCVTAPIESDWSRWRCRMFAPSFGIPEDPATGSAAAAFAGVLARLEVTEVTIDQGVEMGRPSTLFLTLGRDDDGGLTSVQVGGHAVVIGSGKLHAP